MSKIVATVASVFAAAAAPAAIAGLIMLLVGRSEAFPVLFQVLATAFVVALAHAVALGLPAVWLLRRTGCFRPWLILCTGFLVGLIPMAVWSWPYRPSPYPSSAWINGVQTLNNGVPTLAGWLGYIQGAAYAGAFCIVGALAFYFTFKGISPNNSFKPTPLRGAA